MSNSSEKHHVLFVDDEINQIETHISTLKGQGYKITIVRTVNQAKEYIEDVDADIHFVSIDLYLPQDYNALLNDYRNKLKHDVNMNQGVLLGSYISDKHRHIDYCYLSSEPGRVEESLPKDIKLFSKHYSEKKAFSQHIKHKLENREND